MGQPTISTGGIVQARDGAGAEALGDVRALLDGGWRWSETTGGLLLGPGGLRAWYDAAACELRFPPEVVEMMRRLLSEEEGSAL